ncbi:hypothetical protein ACHAP4_011756 [Fusarium culmorum]
MARLNSQDEMTPMPIGDSSATSSEVTGRSLKRKKWIILIISIVSFIICMVCASQYGVDYDALKQKFDPVASGFGTISELSTYQEPEKNCGKRDEVANMTLWNELLNKSSRLLEDKFTIPSLHEIVVVWNDVDADPPKDYVSKHTKVPVRFRRSEKNSLNQKLLPDETYATQGILLSDDDWNYPPTDLEYAFQQWRRAGMHRLTGAFSRCVRLDENDNPLYGNCHGGVTGYDMVLTGMAFSHMSLLEYYWSTDPLMISLRNYTDAYMNCEDIALNFATSMLTCEGPLQVVGVRKLDHQAAKGGISKKPGHKKRRDRCMLEFTSMFKYFPLQKVDTYLRRGANPI